MGEKLGSLLGGFLLEGEMLSFGEVGLLLVQEVREFQLEVLGFQLLQGLLGVKALDCGTFGQQAF